MVVTDPAPSSGSTARAQDNAGLVARRCARKATSVPISGGSSTCSPMHEAAPGGLAPGLPVEADVGAYPGRVVIAREGSRSFPDQVAGQQVVDEVVVLPGTFKGSGSGAALSAPTVSRNKWMPTSQRLERQYIRRPNHALQRHLPGNRTGALAFERGTHRFCRAAQLGKVQPLQRSHWRLGTGRQPPFFDDGNKCRGRPGP